jgi:hypothetical protein
VCTLGVIDLVDITEIMHFLDAQVAVLVPRRERPMAVAEMGTTGVYRGHTFIPMTLIPLAELVFSFSELRHGRSWYEEWIR